MNNTTIVSNIIPGGVNSASQVGGVLITSNLTAGVGTPGATGATGVSGATGATGATGAAGAGVPTGGTTGQVLNKASNTDNDTAWHTLVKGDVGLGSVDNTADTAKPVSTAQQTALNLKANLASPTFTGTVVLPSGQALIAPALGTPASGVATNLTGTAAGLTAGNVTTNANLTGDVTSIGNATTLTNAAVIAKVLTGYTSGAGTVAATDSILQAIQKLNGNDATNANLTGVITSVGNATSIASQTGTGSKFVVDTTPTLVTPILGVATATSINKVTITTPTTSAVLTLITGSTLATATAASLTLTLSSAATTNATIPSGTHTLAGLDVAQSWTAVQTFSTAPVISTITNTGTITLPTTTTTLAGLAVAQTFTAVQTVSLINTTPQAVTAVANAATLDITHGIQNVTNNSAATLTITLTTTSAVDGQLKVVRVYDFSAVAQTLTFVNTENSDVTVPASSNGSATLPRTVLFQYNSATSKWRCIANV